MTRKIDQVRTIFGAIIADVKDSLDHEDELLLARIDRHRRQIEATIQSDQKERAA
ncbi:hypothetical protein [Paracoccus sp. KR1-242]|uniref:hypothetical protein n=1 Tax=Paracoccus sp. KR1-242 TaxID=3410028 RepID=UPI003C09A913